MRSSQSVESRRLTMSPSVPYEVDVTLFMLLDQLESKRGRATDNQVRAQDAKRAGWCRQDGKANRNDDLIPGSWRV